MKVLLFSRDPSYEGGVVNFSNLLIKQFSSDIHADRFLIGKRPGRVGALRRALQPLLDGLRLIRRLAHEQYDVIHLNPSLNSRSVIRDGFFLLLLKLIKSPPVLVFFRGWQKGYADKIVNSVIRRKFFELVFGQADYYFVLGFEIRHQLTLMGVEKRKINLITTMFNGDYVIIKKKQPLYVPFRLLFMARFIKEKGIYELLEAIQGLINDGVQVSLVMAGAGIEEENIKSWVRKHKMEDVVHLTGYVRDEAKANVLLNADVFILPSYDEGCPNSLLEAMGAGLPVLVTPVGGIPDLVKDGVNGFILEKNTPVEIAARINELIGNPELCHRMGELNSEEAWDRYESKRVVQKIESAYRGMAGRKIDE